MGTDERGPDVRRRAVLGAVVGLGTAAACGAPAAPGPDASGPAALGRDAPAPVGPTTGGSTPAVPTTAGSGLVPPAARAPRPLVKAADVPVGGGRVLPEHRVVVTQPAPGEFRGFGIVCTHDGCELTAVADGTIDCPCHGSRFAVTDGSVVRGPARSGLRTEDVAVDGDTVVLR